MLAKLLIDIGIGATCAWAGWFLGCARGYRKGCREERKRWQRIFNN